MTIKYIIVDDETASHDVIAEYGNNLSYLKLTKHCYNAFEAMEHLREHPVDLIFLDINMPKLTGFDFLKTLVNPPRIIVTTAYKDFALEGYELNIDDYLLKPFSFQRFLKAVGKVNDILHKDSKPLDKETIFIKDNKKHHQIKLDTILYVEGFGNYVKVHTEKQTIITHQTLGSIEAMLPGNVFMKVHKSYIVAKRKIELIDGNQVVIQSRKVPIGKVYRSGISDLLGL